MDISKHGKQCDGECPFYHAVSFKKGWCEFSLTYTDLGLRLFNQKCDIEQYALKTPIFYKEDK